MSSDEVTILMDLGAAPVAERNELHDALLEQLLTELQAPAGWRDRLQLPRVRLRIRKLSFAVAAVTAVAAAIVAVTVVRDLLIAPSQPIIDQPPDLERTNPPTTPTDALGVVLDARSRWLSAPLAVHVTSVTDRIEEDGSSSTTTKEVWLVDDTAWRTTSTTRIADGTSTWTIVWDGERELSLGTWFDGNPSAELTHYGATGRYPFGTPLDEWVASTYAWERRCTDGEVLADTEISGRPASHIRCGGEELWLDVDTGLLLRHERPAGADDHDAAQQSYAVTAIAYDDDLSADLFVTEPPADLPLAEFTERPTALQPGDPAPPFDARTSDGQPVDLEALRGQHVLVVFWSPGLYDLGVVEQIHRAGRDGLTILVYDADWERADTAAEYVATRGYTVPLVFDAEPPADGGSAIMQAWRLGDDPTEGMFDIAQLWVLVGPDGDVVGTETGNLLAEDLDAWLDDAGVNRP